MDYLQNDNIGMQQTQSSSNMMSQEMHQQNQQSPAGLGMKGCEMGLSDNQSWTTDTSLPNDIEQLPNYSASQGSASFYANKQSPLLSPLYSDNMNDMNLFHSDSFQSSSMNSIYKESSPSYGGSVQLLSLPSQQKNKQQQCHQQQKQIQSIQSMRKTVNNNNISVQSTLAHQIQGMQDRSAKNNYTNNNNNSNNNNNNNHITDRFIPSRKESKLHTYQAYECNDNLSYYEQQYCNDSPRGSSTNSTNSVLVKNAAEKDEINQISISQLYKNYVLGVKDKRMYNHSLSSAHAFCPYKNENVLRFSRPNPIQNTTSLTREMQQKSILQPHASYPNQLFLNLEEEACCSHLRYSRKISKVPFKVLDAPALQDDFYLNLIDWSSQNILAVGLSSCVYLWSACSSRVTKLCDFGRTNEVTSVNWSPRSSLISIGTNTGEVEIWDSVKLERVRVLKGHSQRVGTLAWNTNILTSGSRDKTILQRDLRTKNLYEQKLIGHKQEVCGLKWSFDEQQLASGGNDNKLYVWNMHSNKPIIKFGNHNAAVKALAWSPHQHGLLVSGGGTQDRTIRFWNTLTSRQLECIETGSQVCNLIFSKNVNELVSTHGYSQNQIIIWSYPEMEKLITLTGHSCRVLYLAMSPDGQTIVTGAGDETLRFWNVFPSNKERQVDDSSSLLLSKNNFLR